jgi:hypothetical protein
VSGAALVAASTPVFCTRTVSRTLALTRTVTTSSAVAPGATSPTDHVTTRPMTCAAGWVDTTSSPSGSVSTTVTLVAAASGELLAYWIRYSNTSPTRAVAGPTTDLVSERLGKRTTVDTVGEPTVSTPAGVR